MNIFLLLTIAMLMVILMLSVTSPSACMLTSGIFIWLMKAPELPYLVQEYNPTYLNNQTTYQAGRDTKNAKEVQDKQYNQANDLYDSADNLRDQADRLRIIWQCRAWQVRMPA